MNGDPAYNAGQAFGSLIGIALLVLFFVVAGYWLSKKLSKDKEYGTAVKWPIAIGWTLAVLVLLGQCSRPADANVETSIHG